MPSMLCFAFLGWPQKKHLTVQVSIVKEIDMFGKVFFYILLPFLFPVSMGNHVSHWNEVGR